MMIREPVTQFVYVDLGGQVRGKGFPTRLAEKRLKSGVGWTPTNLMFSPLGTIAESPWGPFGDLLLRPDGPGVEVDFEDGTPVERFHLCDLASTDGEAWICCPRSLLKRAVERLRSETGFVLRAAFEHEFIYTGANSRPADMYALDAVRRHGAFGETFLAALSAADVEADSYLAEFGPGQFEVTTPATEALAACDRAVIVKEMARATALRFGHNVTFSPKPTLEGLGSGVHIHFSLWAEDGDPVSHDPAGPFGVSDRMGAFLAGIVRSMPALCALTVPAPVSYLRLKPHVWTGVWSNIGVRDREAGLRVCPTFGPSETATEHQFNIEYRAADATANPYLQLAGIIQAGLAGLREGLQMPEPTVEQDPETMTEAERARRKIVRLPETLDAALAALEADSIARAFLPEPLLAAYLGVKKAELELTRDWPAEEMCRRYVEVY